MEKPYGILLCVSPLIGEILKTGEILPRPLDFEEVQGYNISPQEIIQLNFSSYEEAVINLKAVMEKINGICADTTTF